LVKEPKISGVYDVELIRRQLDQGYLQGDAMLTLRWLLNEYDNVVDWLNNVRDYIREIDDIIIREIDDII